MKEQEVSRYLRYLGLEGQRLQNKTCASFISARKPAAVIVVLMGAFLVLVVSAIGYHAATGVGEEGASAAVSSSAEEQAGIVSNASDGQGVSVAVSSTQALWHNTRSASDNCTTCDKVGAFIELATYCIAQLSGEYRDS